MRHLQTQPHNQGQIRGHKNNGDRTITFRVNGDDLVKARAATKETQLTEA